MSDTLFYGYNPYYQFGLHLKVNHFRYHSGVVQPEWELKCNG